MATNAGSIGLTVVRAALAVLAGLGLILMVGLGGEWLAAIVAGIVVLAIGLGIGGLLARRQPQPAQDVSMPTIASGGPGLLEYALIAGLIAIVSVTALIFLGPDLSPLGSSPQLAYEADLTLEGNPEIWTASERYIYVPPSALPNYATGPLASAPAGWADGGLAGTDPVYVRHAPLPSSRPDSPFGQTSVVTFQPTDFVVDEPGRSRTFIPKDGSLIVIHAPVGAVVETYPASSADPQLLGTSPVRKIKLEVTPFAFGVTPVTVRTAPTWGRDPIWAGVWTASLSTVTSAAIGLIWAVVLVLFSAQIKAGLLWIWRKVRPPKPASVSP